MNGYYLVAAVFATVLSLGHPYFGEYHFFNGVKFHDSMWGDVDMTTRLIKGGWHIATAALAMSAFALYSLAFDAGIFADPRTVAKFITFEYIGFLLVVAYYAAGRPFILVRAPLWAALTTIAVCSWLGANAG
jgi:hypothetical protein